MSKTELYNEIAENIGIDVSALPDRLESTFLAAILAKMGGNPDELLDRLPCTYLSAIAECCGNGSSGGSGVDTEDIDLFLDQINGEIIGERVFVVTFVYNGTTYQEEVFEGYDCPDPVSTGKIETPTKESTRYVNYIFSGWSLTDGGVASSSALSAIDGDRTVYAVFKETLIYLAKGSTTDSLYGDVIDWKINPDYILTLSGSGHMPLKYDSYNPAPWSGYMDRITSVVFGDGITYVSDYAFNGASKLTQVSFSDSIEQIGISAFSGCAIESVELPEELRIISFAAFGGCPLTNVTIPYDTLWFGSNSFEKSLTSLTLMRTDGWYLSNNLGDENAVAIPVETVSDPVAMAQHYNAYANGRTYFNKLVFEGAD